MAGHPPRQAPAAGLTRDTHGHKGPGRTPGQERRRRTSASEATAAEASSPTARSAARNRAPHAAVSNCGGRLGLLAGLHDGRECGRGADLSGGKAAGAGADSKRKRRASRRDQRGVRCVPLISGRLTIPLRIPRDGILALAVGAVVLRRFERLPVAAAIGIATERRAVAGVCDG